MPSGCIEIMHIIAFIFCWNHCFYVHTQLIECTWRYDKKELPDRGTSKSLRVISAVFCVQADSRERENDGSTPT